MDAAALRELQRPLKDTYRTDPDLALVRLHAHGVISEDAVTCTVDTWAGQVRAGLHPSTGGGGADDCSADMLLQALAGCAGVTLRSLATAMRVHLQDARVDVAGTFDARGTLGLDRRVPVGLTDVTVSFSFETDADDAKVQRLLELTDKYCVVAQTLRRPPELTIRRTPAPG